MTLSRVFDGSLEKRTDKSGTLQRHREKHQSCGT